jgi:NTE family protein
MFRQMRLDILPSLRTIPLLSEVPARAMKAAGREARWFSIPAGAPLFLAGETADTIYFTVSGTLGAFSPQNEFLGHIRAGEPAGEMAVFLGGIDTDGDGTPDNLPHTSSVYALRDTEIIGLSRKGWKRLVKAEPELMESMVRVILARLGRAGQRANSASPKVFTLLATSPTIDLALQARILRDELTRLGLRAVIVNEATGDEKPAGFFDGLEAANDVAILIATLGDSSWCRLAMRQADRIWVVGRGDARPSRPLMPDGDSPAQKLKLVDVILWHPGSGRRAASSREWMEAAGAMRVFQWRGDTGPDARRIARVMAGRSVGVVFSGGGARAYSHIGVVRALREAGIPIDFAGGASMGAVIAACVAMGWDDDEIDWRIREAFVKSNPLGDYHLPVISMVRGKRVNQRLETHFGDADINELPIPFFATSTNLTTGSVHIHRSGRLREALRASISLPGILPPVIDGQDILVDGAVLNNFPVEAMRDMHRGFVVASDVSRQPAGLNLDEFREPPGFFRWVLRHGFSSPPPIAGLLMRAATLRDDRLAGRDNADLLILPELPAVQLRDWTAYDEAVAAGYAAAKAALETHELRKLTGSS